jgi:hypothetical protein
MTAPHGLLKVTEGMSEKVQPFIFPQDVDGAT